MQILYCRQHTATYQIKRRKQAEKVVIALARTPENGQTIVTETCRVLIMFYKHF